MFTVDKVITPGQHAQDMLKQMEENVSPYDKKTINEHLEFMKSKDNRNSTEFLFEGAEKIRVNKMRLSNFSEQLSEKLLHECICKVFDKIMEAERCTPHESAIGHSMISKLIKEEGCINLLARFEDKSLILSEFARYTNKYRKIAMEAVNKKLACAPDDDSCYVLDKEIAEKFMSDISDLVPEKTINIIRDRVEDAMQDFIDQNTENKQAIKDIYLNAKLSVEKAATDSVKEEYTARAKNLANRVYERPTKVFGAMVNIIGESVLTNASLKAQYIKEGKIKMESLCDDVRVMYTVLEMANTLNMINVNESYIKQVIKDLKE